MIDKILLYKNGSDACFDANLINYSKRKKREDIVIKFSNQFVSCFFLFYSQVIWNLILFRFKKHKSFAHDKRNKYIVLKHWL